MRLFAALQLTEEMRSALVCLSDELTEAGCGGRPVPPGNLHLTLCFIGETERKDDVVRALESISYEPFRISLTETGCFGDLLWAGADGGGALIRLASDIRKALDSAGIPYDGQLFVPHIALLRKVKNIPESVNAPKAEMTVERFSLMRSEQAGGRMVYTELASF